MPPFLPPLPLSLPFPQALCGPSVLAWPGGEPPLFGHGGCALALPPAATVGFGVGLAVGLGVGRGVAAGVGRAVGRAVRWGVGAAVGAAVGLAGVAGVATAGVDARPEVGLGLTTMPDGVVDGEGVAVEPDGVVDAVTEGCG